MMQKGLGYLLVAALITMGSSTLALAELEWDVVKKQGFDKAPLDIAFSQSDGRIFVLFEGGEVQILSATGELQERFALEYPASSLALTADGSRLFLADPQGKQLQIIDVAVVHDLPINNSPVKGAADAPVTLTVFSDFQCPYCARLTPLIEQIVAAYPQQVKLVFKQFPLQMHKFAEKAAIASLAARDQGKFWPFHDLLFANFNQLSDVKIRELATKAGLDMTRFDEDLKNPAYPLEINADQRLGQQAGVRGTPAVYINGKQLKDRSQAGFRAMIERELAKAKP